MDNTTFLLRGWRESLAGDIAMSGEKAQAYSLVEKQYAGRTVDTYGQWVEMFQQWCAGKRVGLEAVSGVEEG